VLGAVPSCVVVAGGVVAVVPVALAPVAGGVPAAVTVWVWDPHPPRIAPPARPTQSVARRAAVRLLVIGPMVFAAGELPSWSAAASGYDHATAMSGTPEQPPVPERGSAATRRSRRELTRRVGLIALAVVVTLFAVLNVGDVKVDWIFGSGHAPLIVVIVISVLVGIVLTYMAERVNRKRRQQ
jgi:uncharacterized integral membrane protein